MTYEIIPILKIFILLITTMKFICNYYGSFAINWECLYNQLFSYLRKPTISLIWVIFPPLYPREILETTVLNSTLHRRLFILTLIFHLGPVRRLCFSVYKSVSEDGKLDPPL